MAESFDFSELTQLAADLDKVPDNAGPLINSAIQVTSIKVKKSAAKRVGKSPQWSAAAGAIDYEVKTVQAFGVSAIQSEIGYDKEKRAGGLGNLREFGAPDSSSGPLAPHNDLATALHENEKDFLFGLIKATEDAERRSGL
jgi:hypothetical protein